jgi:thiamine-monophosphate kinase
VKSKRSGKIGDDVAVLRSGVGNTIVKVDMLVEHTDVPPGMTYRQAARKAVAMCVSDFAAKGAKPDSFLVSIGVRKGITKVQVNEIAEGLKDAAEEWEVKLVGGDTNEADELIIDCVMLGLAQHIVGRDGARPGDILVVTGAFGYPPAGLRILMAKAKAEAGFKRRAAESVLKPSPNLELGIRLAPYLSSSMDSSDGLARSLHTLSQESGVGFEVRRLPVGEGVEEFAKENGIDPVQLVLQGGEEYLIVGTIPRRKIRSAEAIAKKNGGRLLKIGIATAKKGRVELRSGTKSKPIANAGWTHLGNR